MLEQVFSAEAFRAAQQQVQEPTHSPGTTGDGSQWDPKSSEDEEWRLDPADFLSYTYPAVQEKYKGQYSEAEIKDYWNKVMPRLTEASETSEKPTSSAVADGPAPSSPVSQEAQHSEAPSAAQTAAQPPHEAQDTVRAHAADAVEASQGAAAPEAAWHEPVPVPPSSASARPSKLEPPPAAATAKPGRQRQPAGYLPTAAQSMAPAARPPTVAQPAGERSAGPAAETPAPPEAPRRPPEKKVAEDRSAEDPTKKVVQKRKMKIVGPLLKQSGNWMRGWQLRWFEIRAGQLIWWDSPIAANDGEEPAGRVPLRGTQAVPIETKPTQFSLRVTTGKGKVYILDADAWGVAHKAGWTEPCFAGTALTLTADVWVMALEAEADGSSA